MAWDEVRRLDESERVEVGAHTVTHPVLASLPPADQERELRASKAALEERLQRPVTTLSYPFGIAEAFGSAAPVLARDAGFAAACAVAPVPVTRGVDLFRLPRFYAGDWDGDTFARRLRGFFRS
jgi:peptidoglycan/xylan/chitin deacetylase (PgdA/CDA1 family)